MAHHLLSSNHLEKKAVRDYFIDFNKIMNIYVYLKDGEGEQDSENHVQLIVDVLFA